MMRSKASYKGHPVHPALIPFPIAFLTGALLFDLAGVWFERPSLCTTAAHLTAAGVVAALIAAVPGIIDYLHTVPPDSTGKRRATKHAAANLTAVVLFATAWWVRPDGADAPGVAVIALELVGAGLLAIGGWMGGTLTFRNQIGVDHRYARAGKWKEQSFSSDADEYIVVAGVDELHIDQMKLLELNGRRIVLARTDNGYVAFEDRCPHRGGSLAGGVMMCGTVQCPWHGSQFDGRTGEVRAGPAERGITTFDVDVHNGKVRLRR